MIAGIGRDKINWHQAFVEVALIGLGVLAALAVDSWWDERFERSEEVQYLKALQADFETNRDTLTERIQFEEQLIDYGKTLHVFLESDQSDLSLDELYELINNFYTLYKWNPITGTYDEMLGSGRLLFIQNAELRRKLSQYAHMLNQVRDIENYSWTSWFNEQSPYFRKHSNTSQFEWVVGYKGIPSFDVNLQDLRSREFHNLVSAWMSSRYDIITNYRRAVTAGDEVLELISSELN